jgi:two-component system cell cycle sensor histidine kinase/response regulator CckA
MPSEHRDGVEAELLGRLAARLAGEFEHLFGRLSQHIERLDEVAGDRAEVQDELADARDILGRGSEFVRQLAAFGGSRSLVPERRDLRSLLGRWWPQLQQIAGAEHPLELHLRGSSIAQIDEQAFARALANLCANAGEASPRGSTIELHASATAQAIHVAVVDRGHGMAPDLLERAGEPFFSTKPRRAGLGLAAARAIVEAHGGQLALDTTPGVGTTVHIRLPTIVAGDAVQASPGVVPVRALIVAHERLIVRWMRRSLTSKGCDVRVASDVLEAREHLRLDWPELILVDRHLPDGDARNLAVELALDRPARPLLFASSRSQLRRDRDRALTPLPATITVLEKPFSTRRFDEVVRRVLADLQARRTGRGR